MAYRRKTTPRWKADVWKVLFVGLGLSLLPNMITHAFTRPDPVNPMSTALVVEKEIPVEVPAENIDTWIREAAAKYQNASYPESYLKYQLHCLANKESGHRHDNHTKCGDNGASCGLYQYKQPTWNGFRKLMIKEGLATEIGSLWDDKLQVETTAWALSEGRHQNWGPWLRGQCH